MSYSLQNTSKYIGEKGNTHWWSWTAFIKPENEDDINEVKYVEYQLHSSFKNPIKKSRKVSEGFSITLKGWGTFLLRARIIFNDPNREAVLLSHQLEFKDD